jgi:chromosome segregation ATPase
MAQQADAERIINLTAQRLAGYLGEANKEAAILQEALERTQQELEEAKARIAELEGTEPDAAPKPDLPQATPEQLVAAAAAHAQAEQDRLDQAARDGLETGRKQPAPTSKTK